MGSNVDELRELNNTPPRMQMRSDSTLVVPRAAHAQNDVAEHIADLGALALTPDLLPLRRVQFKAGKNGDTLAAVARRHRVPAAQVAQWKGLAAGTRLKAGQSIVVMQAADAASGTPRQAAYTVKPAPAPR